MKDHTGKEPRGIGGTGMNEHLAEAIDAWKVALAARIKLYIENTPGMTQDILKDTLGYSRNSTISLALSRPTEKIGEPFISKLSGLIPEFSDCLRQYRELVDSRYGPPEKLEALIESQQEKEDKIQMLREAIARLQELLEIRISE